VIWIVVHVWICYFVLILLRYLDCCAYVNMLLCLNIIKIIKPRSSLPVLQVHPVWKINKILYRICFGHLLVKMNQIELEGNGTVIFRRILAKCVVRIWMWLSWLQTMSSSTLFFGCLIVEWVTLYSSYMLQLTSRQGMSLIFSGLRCHYLNRKQSRSEWVLDHAQHVPTPLTCRSAAVPAPLCPFS
jgi:hypothetical protein